MILKPMHPDSAGIAVCNVVSKRGQRGGETGNIVHCRLEAGRVSDDFAFWIPSQSLLYILYCIIRLL